MGNASMWARAGVGRLMVLAVNGEIKYRLVLLKSFLRVFSLLPPTSTDWGTVRSCSYGTSGMLAACLGSTDLFSLAR
jgi:hypothetical protein